MDGSVGPATINRHNRQKKSVSMDKEHAVDKPSKKTLDDMVLIGGHQNLLEIWKVTCYRASIKRATSSSPCRMHASPRGHEYDAANSPVKPSRMIRAR